MMDEQETSRLARYFAGECSPAEALATQQWIAQDAARQLEAERIHELWRASAVPGMAPSSDAAWQRLAARMHVTGDIPPVALHHADEHVAALRFRWRRSARTVRGARIAAALVLCIASGAAVAGRERLLRLVERGRDEVVEAPSREFRTARGQRAVITLGDGSRVELGAESVLRVRPFGSGARVLFLDGQAAFEVVHDSAHPFVVHAANAITEDLGTRFTVRAYHGDRHVEVLVSSGKVALRAIGAPASSGTLLGPADLGVLDSAGRATVRNGVDSTQYLAWTHDRFHFENAPLAEVIPEIARRFDVRIEVADSLLLQRRVTLSVGARSLSEVLGAVTTPLRLRFETSGSTVVIR